MEEEKLYFDVHLISYSHESAYFQNTDIFT